VGHAPVDWKKRRYLRRTEEADAETVESARFKTLERSVVIASEDEVGEVRAQLLHGAHDAPKHALAAAAIIHVQVEELCFKRGLTAEAEDALESCSASHRAHFRRGVGWRRAGSGTRHRCGRRLWPNL
jgi:hypothetical protein